MKEYFDLVGKEPLSIHEYSITPFRDHHAVKNREHETIMFADEEDIFLLEQLKTGVTISRLVDLYHQKFRKYSYKKVFSLILRLLKSSFFKPESENLLLRNPVFKPHAPDRRSEVFISVPAGKLLSFGDFAWKRLDSTAAIIILAAFALFSLSFLVLHAGELDFVSIGGIYGLGLACWLVSLMLVFSLRNLFKDLLLRSENLAVPEAGIRLASVVPYYHVRDADIITLGWAPTLRFHAAAILFPFLVSTILAIVHLARPAPELGIPIGACVIAALFSVSPFTRSELMKALDRLSGRRRILESLGSFFRKKFLRSLIRVGQTFHLEVYLILFSAFGAVWMYLAYLLSSYAFSRYLSELTNSLIWTDLALEKASIVIYLLGILAPLILIAFGVLRLLLMNLHDLLEGPIERLLFRATSAGRGASLTREQMAGALKAIPIFASIPPADLEALCSHFKPVFYGRNRVVIRQGDRGEEFFIIFSGKAEVILENPDGTGKKLAILSEGDSFGEIALLQETSRTATVKAAGPLVCLALDRESFAKYFEKNAGQKDRITRMIQLNSFLKKSPLFSDISPETMCRVIQRIEEEKFGKGIPIVKEGEAGEKFYIIREGGVSVWKKHGTPAAHRLGGLSAGEYFGEIALFEESARTATVLAETDSTVLALSRDDFFELLHSNVVSGMMVEEITEKRKKEMRERLT